MSEEDRQVQAFTKSTEWFAAFLANTDQKEVTFNKILEKLQKRFPRVWQAICNPNYKPRILFIGAGTGGLEIPLVQKIIKARQNNRDIEVFYEDPSGTMKEKFKASAQETGIDDVVIDYSLKKFEDPDYEPPDADLTIASHVWYYVGDWKGVEQERNSLAKFTKTVTTRSGVALIVLQSTKSDNFRIRTIYSPQICGIQERCAEQLTDEFDRLGIDYQYDIVEAHTNVGSCFQDGEFRPTGEGKNLLSFILRKSWDSLGMEIRDGVARQLSQIVEQNGTEEMIFRDGYIWIPGR